MKSFPIILAAFIGYVVLLGLGLFDFTILLFPIILLFPVGIFLGLWFLFKSNETLPYWRATKFVLALFYVFSPLLFIILYVLERFITPLYVSNLWFLIAFFAGVLLIISLSSIYFFQSSWSVGKKLLFITFQSILGIAASVALFTTLR